MIESVGCTPQEILIPPTENTFYMYRRPLIEQGYITKKTGAFKNTVYIIEDKPKKFFSEPENPKRANKYAQIHKYGLFSKHNGYGFISRAVMSDPRLSITAKAEYVYHCVFAGKGKGKFADKGRTSKPKLKHILYHLDICSTTYYSHYNRLCELNYITPFRQHNNGRFDGNIYLLNDRPDVEKASDGVITIVKSEKKPVKHKTMDASNTPTVPAEHIKIVPQNDRVILEQVKKYLWELRQIPYFYNQSRRLTETAVRYLTEYDTVMKKTDNELINAQDRAFALFNDALTDLICLDHDIQLRGSTVHYAAVIDRLKPFMEFNKGRTGLYDDFISLNYFCDAVCKDYLKFCAGESEIHKPLILMQTFIWTALINGKAALMTRILQD